ncbi:MAG: zinc ribbon domain-containing protein [Pseudomonadota bacterium]
MIECPRCKFMQPEDRFCANCGIDMESYNSKPPPIHQQVFSQAWVPAVLAGAVIAAVVIFFQMQPDDEPEFGNTLTRDEEFSKEREQKIAQQKEDFQKRRQARKDARRAAQLEQQKQRAKDQDAKAAAALATSKSAAASSTPPVAKSNKQLQIGFYEIGRVDADTLISAGEPIDEFFFTVRKANLDLLQGAQKLPGTGPMPMTEGKAISKIMSFAPSSGELSWEFALEILPSKQGEKLELSVSGGLYTTGFQSIPASFDLNPVLAELGEDEVLVLVGMIPHAPVEDPEAAGLTGSPLQVLTSDDFQKMQSDFFVVLEPK